MLRRRNDTNTDTRPVGDAVGRSLPRREAREKATGAATYADDIVVPRMLYGAVLGSDYAHARIVSCDTSAAEALPGVKAVLTGDKLGGKLFGKCIEDEPVLATGKVRYVGEPVAAVAAVDRATAKRALQLIELQYEELPAVFDAEAALAADAPPIHEARKTYVGRVPPLDNPNLASYTCFAEGDAEAAWAQCDVIVEDKYETPAQQHMYMEPCSTLAAFDRAADQLTLWTSTQGVFIVQYGIAKWLGLPMSKVRVIAPYIGGAFGGKGGLTNQQIAAALAIAAAAPVKLTYSREDDMTMMKSRHPSRIYMRTGAKRDGTLVAREVRIYLNTGAYADEGPFVNAVAANFSRGPYRIPNIKTQSWCVYTNHLKAGGMRGFGVPQANYASELQIDAIAARLGLDPIEVRLKNALGTGDKFLGGQNVDHGTLARCLEAVRQASGWEARRARPAVQPGKRRGIGVASATHVSAMNAAGATVKMNEDGTLTVNTGAVDVGQGSDTALSQLAAGVLGVSLDQIKYAAPDTNFSPYNHQTGGSRTTYTVGVAVQRASENARDQIFDLAAELLECPVDDLELRPGGWVGLKGAAGKQVPFSAIAKRSLYTSGGPVMGTANWLYEAERFDPKRTLTAGFAPNAVGVFLFAALVVEVDVDEATGKVEVVEAWAAHDVGRAINPGAVEGQIHGGLVQGFGFALIEELLWDEGRLVNPSMMDYKVPGAMDVPYEIHAIVLEDPEATGPFGARGVGEIPLNLAAPAICNAIEHATGVKVTTIPATGERVLRSMLQPR
ncbi:MAG TPA: xanthine dehydrogenase family protein molybdopterin-binding subunit [Steroidobacteraceae bacterium]|nr:xanthine dehydrogenase family protein molybdopterin-binding subunit [Steroidobacteraceae bacterium]